MNDELLERIANALDLIATRIEEQTAEIHDALDGIEKSLDQIDQTLATR